MKEERLNLKNRLFTSLKTSSITFPPKTPHYAIWHYPPKSYIVVPAKLNLPRSKQIKDPLQHNPLNPIKGNIIYV